MRYQLYTAWTSSVLLAQAISLPRHKTQHAEIGTRSVNLQFNANCPESRHGELTAAWDDALRLAANVGTINFNEAVAIDFLGPPAINVDYQSEIQKIFTATNTLAQGWKTTPASWKVRINMDCSTEGRELNYRCKKVGAKAFTWNTESIDGTGDKNYRNKDATANINDNELQHWNMEYYKNRAMVVFHEMMHANRITYEANGNRHMEDLTMKINLYEETDVLDLGEIDEVNLWRLKVDFLDAYGAQNAKVLARTSYTKGKNLGNTGMYVSENADNYAQYALARYVQDKIKAYPWLPIANGEALSATKKIQKRDTGSTHLILTNGTQWGLNKTPFEAGLKNGTEDLSFTLTEKLETDTSSDADGNPTPPKENLAWTTNAQYPPDYLKQQDEWFKEASSLKNPPPVSSPILRLPLCPTTPPPPPVDKNECTGIAAGTIGMLWVEDRDVVAKIAEAFCRETSKTWHFEPNTRNSVEFSASHPADENTGIPLQDDCVCAIKGNIIDGCDGGDLLNNPFNFKYGGKFTSRSGWIYTMKPLTKQEVGNNCEAAYALWDDEFEIRGKNFPGPKIGVNGLVLMNQIDGCRKGGLRDWVFKMTPDDPDYQWYASGKQLIGNKNCTGDAIINAGGSTKGRCSGRG